jgi:hypothetical protein
MACRTDLYEAYAINSSVHGIYYFFLPEMQLLPFSRFQVEHFTCAHASVPFLTVEIACNVPIVTINVTYYCGSPQNSFKGGTDTG